MDVPSEPLIPIGQRLAVVLKGQGKSAAWLAEGTGVSRSTVTRVINGERKNPKPETLLEFAEALGMTVDQLVAGTDAAERVTEASTLVPGAQYKEVLSKMFEYEQKASEAQDCARRATDDAQCERDRRIQVEAVAQERARAQSETIERLERERDDAVHNAERQTLEAKRYRRAFERAAAEIIQLREQVTHLGEVIDDSRKTGRTAAILAGTAMAASVLTYLNTKAD